MSETAIKVENLGKQYRLGLVGATSIIDDMRRSWAKLKGKDDPTLNIGQSNILAHRMLKSEDDYIWALKDINFEVKQGEVLGIIGKNGAGKSTLLKILSKVTSPTLGSVKVKGRIASLLEVGTGFHGELTGRENIFMNGAILGMTKAEIKSKFDEIVDFSGVERYIDTPVKRYSSGMYVRLAFAVAAHLEPEILILDEVLAVGDAKFQKKCLGKMSDVAKGGRTVLFVSHNMAAVENLCSKAIVLNNGTTQYQGKVDDCVKEYMSINIEKTQIDLIKRIDRRGTGGIKFNKVILLDKNRKIIINPKTGEDLVIRIFYDLLLKKEYKNCRICCEIHSSRSLLFVVSSEMVGSDEIIINKSGYIDVLIEEFPVSQGSCFIHLFLESNNEILDLIDEAFTFDVIDGDFFGFGKNFPSGWTGNNVLIKHKFIFEN